MKYRKSDIDYLNKYIKEHNLDDIYYNKCLSELDKGRAIQYIIGEVNFYGYDFIVNENVLIPRYETELLVDLTIKKIKEYFGNKEVDIIDLGTGSGCIAVSLKKNISCNMDALDISHDAICIAKENAKRNEVSVNFINSDMCEYRDKKYDVIISNPPYIRYDEDIMDIVKNNEPHLALYADDNGLFFYKRIIDNIPYITEDKYLVCFEIGCEQANDIINYVNSNLECVNVSVIKDYNNLDRFIFIDNFV